MTKEENLTFSQHAWYEMHDDGISATEIAEAISRGTKIRQNGHYITMYKYFTVVYKQLSDARYKIITVYAGYPKKWKNE